MRPAFDLPLTGNCFVSRRKLLGPGESQVFSPRCVAPYIASVVLGETIFEVVGLARVKVAVAALNDVNPEWLHSLDAIPRG
jgi:hypothetical protein